MRLLRGGAFALLVLSACAQENSVRPGTRVELRASGPVEVETGPFYSGWMEPGTGTIRITAVDFAEGGGRVTPLPPHDSLSVEATIDLGRDRYELWVRWAMIEDPLGRWGTWGGVGLAKDHHGRSRIGTTQLPNIHSKFAAWGIGDVWKNDTLIASGVPVHVMTVSERGIGRKLEVESRLPNTLELDVGDPDLSPIPELPAGHLRVIWRSLEGEIPVTQRRAYALAGSLVLLGVLAGALLLNRLELRGGTRE